MDDRARILLALETADVRTATGGKLSAPCVVVEPGDPWSEPRRLPGRVSRWRLMALASKPDTEGSFGELGDLIDRVDGALRTVPGCELPAWSKPTDYSIGGVPYAGTVAIVQISSI